MDRVTVGVLGTGVIVRDYHMPCLRSNPKAEVVAVGNLHTDSLQAMATDLRIPKIYDDFEVMARDEEIDAVVVALPNYLHAPVTIQMLEAGKHVLCEKPMAMSVAEAEEMIEASRRSGSKLMIAHMWRFDREVLWLRNLVASGTLGKVIKAKSHALWLYEGPQPDSWFAQRRFSGGGALADMGIHSIDTLRFVLGGARPTKVFANVGTHFEQIELEDTATLLIEFEGGVAALVEAGWYHLYGDGLEGYTQVYGTKGYARALPSELHTHVEGVWSVTDPVMPKRSQQCDLPMYQDQMDHFLTSILTDSQPSASGEDGLWAMRVLEAAYRSAESGEAVSIEAD
ncbi:Gfo/Idh/MocA family protein [Chloroflexota bacterium]